MRQNHATSAVHSTDDDREELAGIHRAHHRARLADLADDSWCNAAEAEKAAWMGGGYPEEIGVSCHV